MAAVSAVLQVHRVIELRAQERPGAVAITDGFRQVSYGELNGWANRIAGHLLRIGVSTETPVAVLAERSAAEVAAQLAVLKTGACFIPLDVDHPSGRLCETIAESGARILLATSTALPGHQELLDEVIHVVDIEAEGAGAPADAAAATALPNPSARAHLDNLAYVIFTSGSTGRPKGVEVTRGNLAAFVNSVIAERGIDASSRSAHLASPAFDAAVWEIWPFLASGASIHLADRETLLSPRRLIRWLARERITLCFVTTALAEVLLARRWPRTIALRLLIAGGERLRLFAPSDLPFAFYNAYGPTECTVFTTWGRVPRASSAEVTEMPAIGRALDHLHLRLLDRRFEVIDSELPGELAVGGASVARGYRGRPALTAEAWVPDPQGPAGSRLYRTGDLVRRLADGDIDFLGRIDNQVKIRGFRVELGEVEVVLMSHPTVAQAAVVVLDDESGVSLAAFVTATGGQPTPTTETLRTFLSARLPEAMVPARLIVRDHLPMTPNLKVDRAALVRVAQAQEEAVGEGEAVEPGAGERGGAEVATGTQPSPVELRLADIFAEVLGLPAVEGDDDFLALGGHSLLVTRVCSRVLREFGVPLAIFQVYESPSARQLAPVVEALVEEAGGLSALDGGVIEPIPRPASGELEPSFAQQRLWFLDRLLESSAVYNVPFTVDLRGSLVPAALAMALAEVVRRHEGLRAFFPAADGQPVQKVTSLTEVESAGRLLPVVDLSGCSPADRRRARRALGEALARRPFQLDRPPLYRFALLNSGPAQHTLLGNIHHILCDGWSMAVLLGDLAAFYREAVAGSLAAGGSTTRPLPTLQYADYAAWQRSTMSGEVLERQLTYWRGELADAPTVLELPTDRPRPSVESTAGGRVIEQLPEELCDRLSAFARKVDSSLYGTLFAALAALLGRFARVSDLVLGCPIANRRRLEAEELIGFMVNTLPLRAEMGDGPSFLGLVAQVSDRVMAAHEHQDLPFERLVEELASGRGAGLNPLVSVLFVMQNAPPPPAELTPGVAMEWRELETGEAIAELSVIAEQRGGEIELTFDYRTELWDETTIRRLARGYRRLLSAAVSRPELALRELPISSPAERHQLVHEWNDTAWPAAEELYIHRWVEARAAASPHAVAVVGGSSHLSYGELDRRAADLARGLCRIGVAPERRVGLWLDRSPEMVVAMLAVLKAGGAFVALDPVFPDRRGDEMLRDAEAVAVIFRSGRRRSLQRFGGSEIEIDAQGWRVAARGETPLEPATELTAANLAYVIFTSGSTGKPKGVAVAHETLSNLVAWYRRAYALSAEDHCSAMSGPAFDALVFESWPALAAGGRLEIVDDEIRSSPLELVRWMEERALTVSWVPTPVAEAIFAEGVVPGGPLRCLQTAGDRLHRLPVAAQAWPLYNNYGPTEATVCTSWGRVFPDPTGREPSIGRPILGVRVHVLAGAVEVVPIGMPGELCIGGRGVARGYLGGPRSTAIAFVPDPFARTPGARLYRSGDLARLRGEGEIEFLGRIDRQVKIRGFRIELGEIESCLLDHPGVREAAVVVVGEGVARQVVSFLVPAASGGGESPASEELIAHLSERLPEYMVPSSFTVLERLPVTASGKVDRRLLAALPVNPAVSAASDRPPETAVERELAAIWSAVLGISAVGREDDFFRLGGNSLVAVQVQSRISSSLGVDLALRDLFDARSLTALARKVEAATTAGSGPRAGRLGTIPRRPAAIAPPPSFAQARLWFLDRLSPGRAVYNVPIALKLDGPLSARAMWRTLREIELRHESVRTVFKVQDGDPYQVVRPPSLRLPVIDLSALPANYTRTVAEKVANHEARLSFDLAAGPLMRTRLLRLGCEFHRLLITLHHITSDGWSSGVLLRELRALYPVMASGGDSVLPDLPVQYADFALWQRQRLSGELLEQQLAFWRRRLADLPPSLDLPTDRPRPPVRDLAGAVVRRSVDRQLGDRIAAFGRDRGATPFMVLQAAFSALLGRYSQQERFATGSPVANRHPVEVEGLIGFFANTLVLVSELDGSPSFSTLLERTRDEVMQALAHQDLPFERLVDELGVERDLSSSPLFNTVLALDTEILYRATLADGLAAQVEMVHPATSKFDLSLFIHDDEGALSAELEYATDLFDAATAARLLAHFDTLLAAALRAEETEIWALPLLTETELAQLQGWESPTPRQPVLAPAETLFELIADQAARSPRAVALIAGEERISYWELLQRVERLSRRLVRTGLGADKVAAILLPRCPELIVAMLAVHAAGGAYLPLEPDFPVDRLEFMLADSDAVVMVTAGSLHEQPAGQGMKVIDIDALSLDEAGPEPAVAELVGWPPRRSSSANLSHLIYTSGSTGRPKGVAISQASAVAMVRWAATVFSPEELAGALASTSVCFDLSVFEIFLPLSCGGTVILADDALALRSLPARDQVTLINTVPSALAALLRLGDLPSGVRTVNLAGEPLPVELARAAYEQPAVQRVYNLYGPSEDTTYSTFDLVERDCVQPPPIGCAVTGSSSYVVDARLRRVAQGVPGELLLGGQGQARGYLGRPRLTAASFVPDSLSGESGRRLYCTGDRVRWCGDGRLDFLGRLDHQVKLRGFRVELGEVELALRRCRCVAAAAAGLRTVAGDVQLVGWLEEEEPGGVEVEELRRQLSVALPAYMVPSSLMVVEHLALTSNGKLDRDSLPDPGTSRLSAEREFVAPSTPLEELVAGLWSEVLGFDQISVDVSFFKLGGHSLSATRVVARLEELFGLEVPLRVFFEAPTIEGLVAKLGELEAREATGEVGQDNGGAAQVYATGGGR